MGRTLKHMIMIKKNKQLRKKRAIQKRICDIMRYDVSLLNCATCAPLRLRALSIIDTRLTRLRALPVINTRLTRLFLVLCCYN